MADDLAAIYASLGLSNPTATANDLSSFQNNVLASDPWNIAAKSLGSFQPNMSTWSPTAQIGTSFLKNFLAGAMGQYARNDATDQLNSVIQVMPQLQSDPLNVAVPEGVDESAFGTLRSNKVLQNLQAKAQAAAENKSALGDLLKTVVGEKAKIDPEGAIAGLTKYQQSGNIGDILGTTGAADPAANPNTPAYKAEQDKIKNERDLFNDFFSKSADYKYKEQGLKALTQAFLDKKGTSDFELIRRAAQMVEPGLAVRQDDQDSLKQAAGALNVPYQTIVAAAGGTGLTDEVRQGMMRIAQRSFDSSLQDYNTIRQNFIDRAKAAKLNENLVVPYAAGKPFAELYPNLNIGGSSQQEIPPGMKLQRNKVTGETRIVPQ